MKFQGEEFFMFMNGRKLNLIRVLGVGLITSCISTGSSFATIPLIKVRIGKKLQKIAISGIDISKKHNVNSKPKVYKGTQTLKFDCRPVAKYKKLSKPLALASMESATGLIKWSSKGYLGKLNLITSHNAKGCDLVNELSLEMYISSLLAKEMSSTWPEEALKAQAVAARSYAYFKMVTKQVSKSKGHEAYYDLENSEKHQVNGTFFDTTESTSLAARETQGEILTLSGGEFTPIFFHSKCGGKTLRPDQVWRNYVKGYQSVDCPFCHKHGQKNWEFKLNKTKFRNVLNRTLTKHYSSRVASSRSKLKLIPDNRGRQNFRIYDNDKLHTIQKSRLRSYIGRKSAPSNYFQIMDKGRKVILRGTGNGHGVGLCQYGAYELARRGYNYKQILAHYFPEHKIDKIY